MRTLIVEDDFISRSFMRKLLMPYGRCDMAVNGMEAIEIFSQAMKSSQRYDLVCLDIMMPEMDGQAALEKIRNMEEERGIQGLEMVKIIMTTVLDDIKNIMYACKSGCEVYLIKPIDKQKLLKVLGSLRLMK